MNTTDFRYRLWPKPLREKTGRNQEVDPQRGGHPSKKCLTTGDNLYLNRQFLWIRCIMRRKHFLTNYKFDYVGYMSLQVEKITMIEST